MFESTKWILKESNCAHINKYNTAAMVVRPPKSTSLTENTNKISEIDIIQQYQFSSSLQRMSVIVRTRGSSNFQIYTKGSPEMIISLSKAETVPKDILLALERYTKQGYRVIAIGRRASISEDIVKVLSVTFLPPVNMLLKNAISHEKLYL